MMQNPELNHQVNQKRFKEQSISRKEQSEKNPNRINWIPIVVILVSALFASQFFSKAENDQTIAEVSSLQEQKAIDSEKRKMSSSEKKKLKERASINDGTNDRRGQKIGETDFPKSTTKNKRTVQEKKGEVESSSGLEYVMLVRQLYAASDYPTGEEFLSKEAKSIQNKNLLEGITAYTEGKNMKEVVLSFQKISPSKERKDYEIAKPFLAHAYFKLGDYKQAKTLFESLSKSSDAKITEDAEWYLTLSLLSDYKNEENYIKKLLEKMTKEENKHSHFRDAIYMQEDLKKIASFNSH